MAIAIICAVERELEPYLNVLSQGKTSRQAMLTIHEGKIGQTPLILLYCGVCKVNAAIAAQVVIDRYHAHTVIVSGTAGGIDRRLQVGDSVIATEACYHDVKKGTLTEYHPWIESDHFPCDPGLLALCRAQIKPKGESQLYFGRIATGEAFIDQEGRERIIAEHGPLCVDMETAAIAHVCFVNQVPFIAVRSISDTAEQSGEAAFDQNCREASAQSFAVVSQLLALLEERDGIVTAR